MGDISKGEGRTVLFVSHNMAAVKSLCTKGIVLEHGLIKHNGDATSSVSYYLGGDISAQANSKIFISVAVEGIFKLNKISLACLVTTINSPLLENEQIQLQTDIHFESNEISKYHITYHLYNEMGEALFSFSNPSEVALVKGDNSLVCLFPKNFFQSGNYHLTLFIIEDKKKAIFIEKDIFSFTVVDGGRDFGVFMGREPGYIKPQFEWRNSI
jgi:lipopolysaccharide transport system ATP-binding protein